MTFSKILFLGLGGAGQRHLRVIKRHIPEASLFTYRTTKKTPLLTPTFSLDGTNTITEKYGVTEFATLEEALSSSPDLVVISSPTSKHMDAMIKAVEIGANILVEKPLSHNLEMTKKIKDGAKEKNLLIYTSFQRRFKQTIYRFYQCLQLV